VKVKRLAFDLNKQFEIRRSRLTSPSQRPIAGTKTISLLHPKSALEALNPARSASEWEYGVVIAQGKYARRVLTAAIWPRQAEVFLR